MLRDLEFYRKLTPYQAVGIAEGFEPSPGDDEYLAAWQYILDKRLYRGLQGWFGRTIRQLLDGGHIEYPVEVFNNQIGG